MYGTTTGGVSTDAVVRRERNVPGFVEGNDHVGVKCAGEVERRVDGGAGGRARVRERRVREADEAKIKLREGKKLYF